MGLAASQVRLLSLTSDKLNLEKEITISSNRKMALTREMSNLAYERNNRLNSFQYQVSTLHNGMQEISYQYLMGKPDGVQDIDKKSNINMMLFESSTGKVVLTSAMASKIGPVDVLINNENKKYEVISRLCGSTNLTVPDTAPEFLNFCADPELVKCICHGDYDNFNLADLTRVTDQYYLQSYFKSKDGNVSNTDAFFEAYQVYRSMDTVGGFGKSGIYGSGKNENDEYVPSHPQEGLSNATISNTSVQWFTAMRETDYVDKDIIFAYENQNSVLDKSTATDKDVKIFLNDIVSELAKNYSDLSGYSIEKLQYAIDQTVNEFYSNSNVNFDTFDFNINDPLDNNEDCYILRDDTYGNAPTTFDKSHLKVYTMENTSNNTIMLGFDATALVSYFYSAIMGDGIGYNSQEGMDTYNTGYYNGYGQTLNYKTKIILSDKTNPDNHAFDPGYNGDGHLFQKLVPAGQNTDQWVTSFKNFINDVKFYYNIVEACIKFGYTQSYDDLINKEPSYVDESLQNGTFQIMDFDAEKGELYGSHNTKYYVKFSEIFKMQDENQRLDVQAWYKKEKDAIRHKENVLDSMIEQMDTELNSINTEIESIKSYIDDSKKKFEWCTG
ncbi:hypothetical protein IJI31_02010 [bacterium]|nr:hypothetical protein [bacterium]